MTNPATLDASTAPSLRAAFAHCADVTRRHSSTFYLGSALFPPVQRKAVRVVYAVCRSGDDAVDEAPNRIEAERRLAAWWAQVERAFRGEADPMHPLGRALAWLLARYDVPLHAFEELRLGLVSDLTRERVDTVDELLVYCRRVGGVIGLLVAPICGYRGGDRTLAQALALGEAMQLTNIVRDVGEDFARGRIYLPTELLERHGVTVADLRSGVPSQRYQAVLHELVVLADSLYRRGWGGIGKLQGTAAWAVAFAALNYQAILAKVEKNGYDNLTRRAYVAPLERVSLLPRTVALVLGGRAGW